MTKNQNDDELSKDVIIPELSDKKNIIGHWSSFFINRYKIAFMLVIIILLLGIRSTMTIKRELQPEIVLPYARVLTVYPGASPDIIESKVTNEIEKKISNLDDVKTVTSYSSFSSSSVMIEFYPDADISEKINDVRESLSSIGNVLPEDAELPIVEKFESNNAPILTINVNGKYSMVELKKYAEDIKDRLESEQVISEALLVGGLRREIKIEVDPAKLSHYGISVRDIQSAISANNLDYPGGRLELDEKNYSIRTTGKIKSADELNMIVISSRENTPIYLKDIAVVTDAFADIDSYSRVTNNVSQGRDGVMESVTLAVTKRSSDDTIVASRLVHDIIEDEKGILYPDDLEVFINGDTSKYIDDSIGAVSDSAFSGLYLVMIVLFLFIGFKEATIVSLVIPIAIMSAIFALKHTGMTLNNITLFSLTIAIGMLVDTGIVVMENIDRLRMKGLDTKTASEVGTNQIAPAIMASTLTTLAAFYPLLLTSGIMGEFIKPLPITVGYALIASFLVAITINPSLCSVILKDRVKTRVFIKNKRTSRLITSIVSIIFVGVLSAQAFKGEDGYGILSIVAAMIFVSLMWAKRFLKPVKKEEHFIIKSYSRGLSYIIASRKRRWSVIGLLILTFAVSISYIGTGLVKVSMFENEDNARLYVDISTPAGSTLDFTDSISRQVEDYLLEYDEIDTFVSNVGITGVDTFDAFSVTGGSDPSIGRITLDLVDDKFREKSSMDLATELRLRLQNIPGASITVRELENGPPSSAAIYLEFVGKDLDVMKDAASEAKELLKTIDGTRNIKLGTEKGEPEIQIRIDRDKAAKYGLSYYDVGNQVRDAVAGVKATTYEVNQDEIDVVIKYKDVNLNNLSDLENLYIYNRQGEVISFNQVAELVEGEAMSYIQHQDGNRIITLSSAVKPGFNALEVTNVFKERVKDTTIEDRVTLNYAGEFEDLEETFSEMMFNMLVAVFLVFIILSVQFNSLSQPLIILLTVPMSLIGVMNGLLITRNSFGFMGFIGVVALVGIVVNDAIVLVDYINYLRKNGMKLKEAVIETGITRFIPVMATTITTAGGVLPLTIREPFFEQLGISLIFGLSMATVLTLLIIPTVYVMFEESRENRDKRKELRIKKILEREATTNV